MKVSDSANPFNKIFEQGRVYMMRNSGLIGLSNERPVGGPR